MSRTHLKYDPAFDELIALVLFLTSDLELQMAEQFPNKRKITSEDWHEPRSGDNFFLLMGNR